MCLFLSFGCFERRSGFDCNDLLVEVSYLQPDKGLEKPGTVVAAGEIGVLEHLLSDFSIELGREVAEVAFHVDQLI